MSVTLACSCLRRPLLQATAPSLLSRSIHAPASLPKRIPAPREPYTTPLAILSASKRNLAQYAPKLGESFEELFSKTSIDLEQAGLTPKERRYLLWILEKYRRGHDVAQVAIPPTPKKLLRGWGPKVQMGKRVR